MVIINSKGPGLAKHGIIKNKLIEDINYKINYFSSFVFLFLAICSILPAECIFTCVYRLDITSYVRTKIRISKLIFLNIYLKILLYIVVHKAKLSSSNLPSKIKVESNIRLVLLNTTSVC